MNPPPTGARSTPNHAPRPDPRFRWVPPQWFVDRHVKLAFRCLDTGAVEPCWVSVYGYDPDQTMLGLLDNDPVHNVGIVCGDPVLFTPDEIEQLWHD